MLNRKLAKESRLTARYRAVRITLAVLILIQIGVFFPLFGSGNDDFAPVFFILSWGYAGVFVWTLCGLDSIWRAPWRLRLMWLSLMILAGGGFVGSVFACMIFIVD